MLLKEENRKEFERVAKPLIQWLNENCHPHVTVMVDCGSAQLFEGVCNIVTEEFIKD